MYLHICPDLQFTVFVICIPLPWHKYSQACCFAYTFPVWESVQPEYTAIDYFDN